MMINKSCSLPPLIFLTCWDNHHHHCQLLISLLYMNLHIYLALLHSFPGKKLFWLSNARPTITSPARMVSRMSFTRLFTMCSRRTYSSFLNSYTTTRWISLASIKLTFLSYPRRTHLWSCSISSQFRLFIVSPSWLARSLPTDYSCKSLPWFTLYNLASSRVVP